MPRLFVVGLGYVGLRLGLQCRELGWEVSGSCRDAERARALYDAHGLDAHAFDGSDEEMASPGGGAFRDALEASTVCSTGFSTAFARARASAHTHVCSFRSTSYRRRRRSRRASVRGTRCWHCTRRSC